MPINSYDQRALKSKQFIMLQDSMILFKTRITPESDVEDDTDGSVLSLGLFPGEYVTESPSGAIEDSRTIFRFEAAWDSSLHNSLLLNRVTPSGEIVYMTISAYIEVCRKNCFNFNRIQLQTIFRVRRSPVVNHIPHLILA